MKKIMKKTMKKILKKIIYLIQNYLMKKKNSEKIKEKYILKKKE